ncbi:MAG: hypothetical protein HC880_06035 [Bacteroidia bacterium]|nr:hypothetical protein [Bacteroidia bacterium]
MKIPNVSFHYLLTIALLWGLTQPLGAQTIYVTGTNDDQEGMEIEKQIQFYLDYYQIYQSLIVIVDLKPGVRMPSFEQYKYRAFLVPTVIDKQDAFQIFIDRDLSSRQRSIVLAHEMVHLRQYVSGDLAQPDPNTFCWKGKPYPQVQSIAYHYREWEQEAFQEQYILYKRYRQSYSQPEQPLGCLSDKP